MNEEFLKKLYRALKDKMSLKDVEKSTGLTKEEIEVGVNMLQLSGRKIYIVEKNGKAFISKRNYFDKNFLYPKINPLEIFHEQIAIVSDTHYGNKVCQPSMVDKVYENAHKRGIKVVLHVGDIVDGDYVRIRPEQQYQLFAHGYDEQTDYVIKHYPKVEGIKTYFIQGSHDETHVKNGGADPAKKYEKERPDMIYLGQDQGMFKLNDKVDIMLLHPGGGCADSLSYKPQKIIENMTPGSKPKILLIGHYHKYYYMNYRNVHAFEVPCLCGQSQFMAKMGLDNVMGALFLDVYYDKYGNVHYIDADEMMFDKEDFEPDDHEKHKQLVLK